MAGIVYSIVAKPSRVTRSLFSERERNRSPPDTRLIVSSKVLMFAILSAIRDRVSDEGVYGAEIFSFALLLFELVSVRVDSRSSGYENKRR